jgi:hypothetical protein
MRGARIGCARDQSGDAGGERDWLVHAQELFGFDTAMLGAPKLI